MLVYPFIAGQKKLTSLLRIGSNSSSDQQTVTAPSDIRKGDLLLYANMAIKTSPVTATVPAGFTINSWTGRTVSISGTTYYFHIATGHKIALGTESSTTITGMSFTSEVNPGCNMAIVNLRGNHPITSVQYVDGHYTTSSGSHLIESSDGSTPLLDVGQFYNLGAPFSSTDQRLFTPAKDDEIVYGSNNMALVWKFQPEGQAPIDITASMASWSGTRGFFSYYLNLGIE